MGDLRIQEITSLGIRLAPNAAAMHVGARGASNHLRVCERECECECECVCL